MKIVKVIVEEIPIRCLACPIKKESLPGKCGSSCKPGYEVFKSPDKRCFCKKKMEEIRIE